MAAARGHWLSWPRPDGISFPDRYPEALPTLGEMVRTLVPYERVDINVRDEEVEAVAREAIGDTGNVFYHYIPSYEPWCRDHGPVFVKRGHELAIVDWTTTRGAANIRRTTMTMRYTARRRVTEFACFQPRHVMEGGRSTSMAKEHY